MKKKGINQKGFTLIEMLIVVTIIGILAALVMPRFLSTADSARKNSHTTDRQHINAQIELYYFNTGGYPTAMTNAGWGDTGVFENYFPDGVPGTCNQGTAWAIDSATNRITAHAGHE